MKSFSQRIGKKPIKEIIQVESMDNDLKNSIWNAINMFYFDNSADKYTINDLKDETYYLYVNLWTTFYKCPIDEISYSVDGYHRVLKNKFFKKSWYEIYDLLEFIPNNFQDNEYENINSNFVSYCNYVLERELSAYRFLNGQITPITSIEEVESIQEVLVISDKFKPVKIHLERALELFSSRTSPDYRNSIKESISAVESYCSILSGDSKATLGQALKQIEKTNNIHPALIKSFSNLYGYTSNADGIRHALLEEENLKQEDAKFMLVSCSAFINYLKQKELK